MNEDPTVKKVSSKRMPVKIKNNQLVDVNEDSIFEIIRDIKDPEHSFTIEELDVIKKEYVKVEKIEYGGVGLNVGFPMKIIKIVFKPTIPHCSMAGIIGLSIKLLLQRFIKGYLIDVRIVEGTHANWEAISKQLNDKDRVLAASENTSLMSVIRECTSKIIIKYQEENVVE